MFRNQELHLSHKHSIEEEKRRQEEALRKERRSHRIRKAKKWAQIIVAVFFVTGLVRLAVYLNEKRVLRNARIEEEAAATRIEQHQAALERMRHSIPPYVEADDWLWCVDHCARYGERGGELYSEGVVEGRIYNYETELEMISVSGPWLTSSGRRHITLTVTEGLRDLNSRRFNTGDIVRLHFVYSDRHGWRASPRKIHRHE